MARAVAPVGLIGMTGPGRAFMSTGVREAPGGVIRCLVALLLLKSSVPRDGTGLDGPSTGGGMDSSIP